jgi:hypothetical protein
LKNSGRDRWPIDNLGFLYPKAPPKSLMVS